MKKIIQWWSRPQPITRDERVDVVMITIITLWVINNVLTRIPIDASTRWWIDGADSIANWICFVALIVLVLWPRRRGKQSQ